MQLKLPMVNDITKKTVLVRTDYNVPIKMIDGSQQIVDSQRIQSSLETINFLLRNNAKVVLISHLGRPKENEVKFSLKPVATELEKLIKQKVIFVDDCIGEKVETAIKKEPLGSVFLLENLRFHAEEKKGDAFFAKNLAQLADVYINEAFSNSHRAHASMVGVAKLLPAFAGFSLAKEVENLAKLTENPAKPFITIIGGAKISDKVEAIENLSQLADAVLVGGGVANNFLKAEGIEIHKSYLQDVPSDLKKEGINYVKVADELIEQHRAEHILKDGYIPLPKIIYPADAAAAATRVMDDNYGSQENDNIEIIDLTNDIQDTENDKDLMYLDIGPKTIRLYTELIANAGTIFWNGPMGVFEKPAFVQGTAAVAQAIAQATAKGAVSILGGGDTIAAINQFGLNGQFTFVSTAGGASLEFLSGKEMPGLNLVCEK